MHCVQDLVVIFEQCFFYTYNTRLIPGADEPLYLPAASELDYNKIYSSHDYFSSALHECAHWCIAGQIRRQQQDYGYWYAPDGRNTAQQKKFYNVEVKPQALEYLFSCAAHYPFRVSTDNLQSDPSGDEKNFEMQVYRQAKAYLHTGMPQRALIFYQALQNFYGGEQKAPIARSDTVESFQ